LGIDEFHDNVVGKNFLSVVIDGPYPMATLNMKNCSLGGNTAANTTNLYEVGMLLTNGNSAIVLVANTIMNDFDCAQPVPSAYSFTLRNCFVYNALSGSWTGTQTGTITGVDPMYDFAPALSDLNIEGDSPMKNAGDDSYIGGSFDYLGNTRSVGSHVDIGAYEIP